MVSLANTELLHVVEAVAREKGISKDVILDAISKAISTAESKRYGNSDNIKVDISRRNGEVKIYRVMQVVDAVENDNNQIDLTSALKYEAAAEIGGVIHEPLPNFKLSRVSAQSAKKVIIEHIKTIEREKEFEHFKEREGELITGKVLRIEAGNIIVDLGGRAEGIIPRREQINNETLAIGSQVKLYIKYVNSEARGHQIILSRADNNMLAKLLALEVPEISDGNIIIKSIIRDAGSKAKVAVYSNDMAIDVMGSCVGMKGSRIQAVSRELNGEKIDVVLWNADIAQFVVNALTPADISKVIIDTDKHKLEIIVSPNQLSVILGRRGQNVRLAAKLVGWNIDIMTDEQESKRRLSDFTSTTEIFMEALDVDEVLAQLLVAEGFNSIEQISIVDINLLLNIDGFDQDIAQELKNRAIENIQQKEDSIKSKVIALGVEQELLDFLAVLPMDDIVKLAENGVKNLEDLCEVSPLEFKKILNRRFNKEQIAKILESAQQKVAQNNNLIVS